jgi:hypothetical protein
MITIKIPSIRGHDVKVLPLLDGKKLVTQYTQDQWITAINGKISSVDKIQDGDKVALYPKIAGG